MLTVGIFRSGWSFVNLILVTNVDKYKYPSMKANALPSFLEREKDVFYFRARQLIVLLKKQFVCTGDGRASCFHKYFKVVLIMADWSKQGHHEMSRAIIH